VTSAFVERNRGAHLRIFDMRMTARVLLLVCGLAVGLSGLAEAKKPKSSSRFVVLTPDRSGAVWVLDTTTQLEWQQTLGTPGRAASNCDGTSGPRADGSCIWQDAADYCSALGHGSRLPKVKELISLVDYGQAGPPLPPGHPFNGVEGFVHWSATSYAADHPYYDPTLAWVVEFGTGQVLIWDKDPVNLGHVWCVR
jgi:hypothetical protein